MKIGAARFVGLGLAGLLLAVAPVAAHHEILAKFDDKKPITLRGVVTLVDWRNPHVHVFLNVRDRNQVANWAVELESPIDLLRSGWSRDTLHAGDSITVAGFSARNGSRQAWGNTVTTADGKRVLNLTAAASGPPAVTQTRPTPRWPDKQPRLGAATTGQLGYWGYPS